MKPAKGSKSASSAIRFFVRTSVRRLGMLDDRLGWMLEMRFCARNRVRRRGWRGKFPSCAISLSVRSIASLSYVTCVLASCLRASPSQNNLLVPRPCFQWRKSCGLDVTILISTQPSSVVSALFNAPRRSSSRSVRQLMKERELLIRSVVSLILAVCD